MAPPSPSPGFDPLRPRVAGPSAGAPVGVEAVGDAVDPVDNVGPGVAVVGPEVGSELVGESLVDEADVRVRAVVVRIAVGNDVARERDSGAVVDLEVVTGLAAVRA